MNIKIKYAITCTLAAAAIVMSALSVPVLRSFGELSAIGAAAPDYPLQMSEPMPFILREYRGAVAVFTPESGDIPALITDIDFNSLREVDKKMLLAGIGAREANTLAALLEDFGS